MQIAIYEKSADSSIRNWSALRPATLGLFDVDRTIVDYIIMQIDDNALFQLTISYIKPKSNYGIL